MKESEMVKLQNASLALGLILNADLDATNTRINLEPGERQFLDGARMGVLETLNNATERLEKLLTIAKKHRDGAKNESFDLQGYLFSSQTGKPTSPVDANGKVIAREKHWGNEVPDGIHQNDGVQGELEGELEDEDEDQDQDEQQVKGQAAQATGWAIAPGVPQHVELAIIEGVESGKTQAQIVTHVSKTTAITKPEVEGHIEHLVRNGKLQRESKTKLSLPVETINNAESPARAAIVEKLRGGISHKATVIEAVAMQLDLPAGSVQDEFETLMMEDRIRLDSGGYVVVDMEASWAE